MEAKAHTHSPTLACMGALKHAQARAHARRRRATRSRQLDARTRVHAHASAHDLTARRHRDTTTRVCSTAPLFQG
eukprot:1336925-Pleurochrysis_carterae.AAC.1